MLRDSGGLVGGPIAQHQWTVMVAKALNELTLTEAANLVAEKRISSEELVRACLARISEREDEVQAWAALNEEQALAQARACDSRPPAGPLHGVPVGIKDVIDTSDLPTQMGSPIYDGHRTHADASCVAMLRAAGAVILGKTVTCEFAGVAPGPTRNPLDLERTPGGSSSGSGAAVADAMVPLALGTQTGGSVLRPASFCGIVGFKPTYGTINRMGLKFAAESLDTIGLMARALDDIVLSLRVLTQRPITAPGAEVRAPRVGICRTYLWEKAQPETRAVLAESAERAANAGARVQQFDLPPAFTDLTPTREILNNVERARALAWEWAHCKAQISPQMTRSIELGLATTGDEYHAALRFAEDRRREIDALLDDLDVLLVPCVNGEAPVGLDYAGDPSFQGLWTILHVPTLTIPAGRGPNGKPVGIQLVARRYADIELLNCARWLVDEAGITGGAIDHGTARQRSA